MKTFSATLMIVWLVGGRLIQSTAEAAALPSPNPTTQSQAAEHSPSRKEASGAQVHFDLQSYIRAVVAQDGGIIAARLALMSNANEVKSTRAAYLPHLSGIADFGVVQGSQHLNLVSSSNALLKLRTVNFGTYEVVGAAVTMPFFKDGTFLGINTPPKVNIKKAEGQVLAAQARLDEQDVIYRATDIFLRAVSTGNQAQNLRSQLELVQKQTDIVEEKAKYNLVTAADVAVADTQLKDARIRFETAVQTAVDSFFHVAELVGVEDPHLLRIATNYPRPQPLPAFDGVMLRINKDHPAIAAQQAVIDGAKANLALKQIQLWPSGTVSSIYRYGEDLSQFGQDQWVSLLAFSAPIFDFGELHYAARAANLSLQSENEKLVKVHDDLRQAIFSAFTAINATTELSASNATLVAEDQRTVDRLDELAKYGQVPIPALLAAELQLLAAKQRQEELTLQLFLYYAVLDRTTAGEWKWIR